MTSVALGARGRAGIELLLAGVLALAAEACGGGAMSPGTTGTGSDDASSGGDGGASDASSTYPPCPQPAGGSCAVENLVCAQSPECRQCVGGFKLVPLPPGYMCVCRAGQWDCLPRIIVSVEVVDCFVEEPLSCQDAQNVYLDPACTEHPPCSP